MPSAVYESLLLSALETSFLHHPPFVKVRQQGDYVLPTHSPVGRALFEYRVLLAVHHRASPRIRVLHARVRLTVLASAFLHTLAPLLTGHSFPCCPYPPLYDLLRFLSLLFLSHSSTLPWGQQFGFLVRPG